MPDETLQLVALVKELKPFLDTGGRVYVFLPHEQSGKRLALRMDDYRVRCLLLALYQDKYQKLAAWDQIYKAMALVQGQLLKSRKRRQPESDDPTMQLFLRSASEHEGWAGSAKEVLDLLRETQKQHKVVKDTHRLPASPTAMGIWLSNNQLELLSRGIELYQPTRRSEKRLWAWRRILEDRDANDALETPGLPLASSLEPSAGAITSKPDTCDTSTTAGIPSDLEDYLKDALS